MSYLLFLDESGHDRKMIPYEVLGGIALHAEKLWPFVQRMRLVEEAAFGNFLQHYGAEIRGRTLLNSHRFVWAAQADLLDEAARRKHALSFLDKGAQGRAPNRIEFTAYGQACLALARGMFQALRDHEAVLLAAVIPRAARRPKAYVAAEFLRKDHVFLLVDFGSFDVLKKKGRSADEGCVKALSSEERPCAYRKRFRHSRRCS